MDGTMFPKGWHPSHDGVSREDIRVPAEAYTRSERPPRYYFIDFGISTWYTVGGSTPLEPIIIGGVMSVPEFHGLPDRIPFEPTSLERGSFEPESQDTTTAPLDPIASGSVNPAPESQEPTLPSLEAIARNSVNSLPDTSADTRKATNNDSIDSLPLEERLDVHNPFLTDIYYVGTLIHDYILQVGDSILPLIISTELFHL